MIEGEGDKTETVLRRRKNQVLFSPCACRIFAHALNVHGCISAWMHTHCICMYRMCVFMSNAFLHETEMDSVWVCLVEGIQCSRTGALGSPSVNRDVGTTKPVYISSILTGTSQPGIRGTANTPLSCAYTEIHVSRFVYTCIILKS